MILLSIFTCSFCRKVAGEIIMIATYVYTCGLKNDIFFKKCIVVKTPNKQLKQHRKFDTSLSQYRSTYYWSFFALIVVSSGVLTKNGILKTMPFLRPPV